MNKKWLILSLVIALSGLNQSMANLALTDLTHPKDPAYRVGISEIPENQYIESEIKRTDLTSENVDDETDVSYSELSLKRLSREIAQDLIYEEDDMVADLTLLWQGAAMQSDTINFALYKLANPDADKPQKSTVKNMLKTIASMSTLAGAGMANPLLAGTSLISGNILGIMSQDTKELNYKYTKVTDADMIILIRKVEDLQQNAVNLYYDYMSAKKQLELTTDVAAERKKRFETAQESNASRELIVVTDAYYRTALDRQKTARSEFLSKRAALEQFVGNETFNQFEEELTQRELLKKNSEQNSGEYKKTIEAVSDYTDNLRTADIDLRPKYETNTDENYDPNLSRIPDLEPLNKEDKVSNTASSQNTTSTEPEKPLTKKEQKQRDKYSTKGLIFIHQEKQNTENVTPTQDVQTSSKDNKVKNKKKKKHDIELEIKTKSPVEAPVEAPPNKLNQFNGVELLPLEDLKAPNYYQNGTIFGE